MRLFPGLCLKFAICNLGATLTFAQPLAVTPDDFGKLDWKQIQSESDMWVYEAQVPGSDVVALKAEGIVNAPLEKLSAFLLDHAHTKDWVPQLDEHRILKSISADHYVEYVHIATPFIVKDRDFVNEVTITRDRSTELKWLEIDGHSIELAEAPQTTYVRGKVVQQVVRLERMENSQTRMLVGFHIDPMGSVPKWMVNAFNRGWPKKTFRTIQRKITR